MNTTYFEQLINQLFTLVDVFLIPLLASLALLLFIWGVIRYFIWGASDPAERETARKYMIYGLFGLVLIVAVWGFVNLIIQILGLGSTMGTVPLKPALPIAQ